MYYDVLHEDAIIGTYVADNEEEAIAACIAEYEGRFPRGHLRAVPKPLLPSLNALTPHEEGWYWARHAGGTEIVYVYEGMGGWYALLAGRTSALPISRFCAWGPLLTKPQY